MKIAIDGDIIVYSVGFASEGRSYLVDGVTFPYKKEAKAFCVEEGIPEDRIQQVLDPEPVEFALSSVKRMIQHICEGAECEEYVVYLTGKGNYREDVATMRVYKGNRKSEKPHHYNAIKEYLIDVHKAVVCEGQEADDAIGIAGMNGDIMASIDKDLNGVPGWHYNWNDQSLYEVQPDEADRFFYTQLLTGDSTDNIPGLYQMTGQRATAKIKETLHHLDTPAAMYAYVRDIWRMAYEKVGMCMDEMDAVVDGWLLEIGQLLWIRRREGETWKPPT
jgi:hypothetical protein